MPIKNIPFALSLSKGLPSGSAGPEKKWTASTGSARTVRGLAACAALLLAAPAPAQEAPAPHNYADAASWLCLPGRDDACGKPLPTTALNANGYGATGAAAPAADPAIDCFYVYPTVSRGPGINADMAPGPEEQAVAAVQFARFAATCRTFAPLYRQLTLASLARAAPGEDVTGGFGVAYWDVVAAWPLAAMGVGR